MTEMTTPDSDLFASKPSLSAVSAIGDFSFAADVDGVATTGISTGAAALLTTAGMAGTLVQQRRSAAAAKRLADEMLESEHRLAGDLRVALDAADASLKVTRGASEE